tara:strand:- start:1647 stop:1862 length:216 start_codon:yes stop_codon:yes gene_type:complete
MQEKLIHTLKMDKIYEGYIIWLYECKTSEGFIYYEGATNHYSGGRTYFKNKKQLLNFYNEWLVELGYKTIN